MLFCQTELEGAYLIDLEPRVDERGFFSRTFCEREFAEHGLPTHFPQCNLSRNSHRGTLRGMHFEAPPSAESKLVRCTSGAIFDVIVDLRRASATRGRWLGVELTETTGRALFVPAGFAHGFLTLTDDSDVTYHMGDSYRPDRARGFRWNDEFFSIAWPFVPTSIAKRDAEYADFEPTAFHES
jgi:dTDP-4-dehydrorhamnose 3,5-epimerase